MGKISKFLLEGREGRSFKATLLFYISALIPLLLTAGFLSIFLVEDTVLKICPLIATVLMVVYNTIAYKGARKPSLIIAGLVGGSIIFALYYYAFWK